MKKELEVFLPSTRDHRSPWLASRLYNIFEQSLLYPCFLFFAFTFAIYVGTLTTYTEYYNTSVPALYYTELALFIYCSIEFCLRIYASESRIRYQSLKGKWRFFCERYLLIDLILLLTYGLVFMLSLYGFPILFLHALRFLQLLRFIPLDRHVKSIPLITSITWQYRQVILAALYLCFLLLLPTAYLLWIVERSVQTNGQFFFRTYTDSLWFTINSMATVR